MSAIKMGGGWHFHLKGRKLGKFGGVLVLQQLYGALLVFTTIQTQILSARAGGNNFPSWISTLLCFLLTISRFSNNQAYPLQLTSLCQRVAPQSLASSTLASPPPPYQASHQAIRCNPEQNHKLQSLYINPRDRLWTAWRNIQPTLFTEILMYLLLYLHSKVLYL